MAVIWSRKSTDFFVTKSSDYDAVFPITYKNCVMGDIFPQS
uniref:Uncharacterized protein n=1 Tax=Klebsiella pneumoniae TaxID=573 RepID=A0A8B0SU21_KLEPN|nr:hypothetical protein [Klebsiella pneumoniae]